MSSCSHSMSLTSLLGPPFLLQAERCPTNSAARGVAEEALLRLGAALRARSSELKSFYESIILGECSVKCEVEM